MAHCASLAMGEFIKYIKYDATRNGILLQIRTTLHTNLPAGS